VGRIEPDELCTKSGMAIVLQSAEDEDAPGVLEHIRRVLEDGEGQVRLPEELHTDLPAVRQWLAEQREHPDWLVLVALARGEVVGMIDFRNDGRRRMAHTGAIGMSVLPAWRGEGLGRALLEALLDWAGASPRIEKIELNVRADNERAIELYRKLGFLEQGRRPRAIKLAPGRYVDDVLMYCFV
jgi:RimJ/RimL family protein N-acetyltransferase